MADDKNTTDRKTSFAKEVHLDGSKQNSLDQVQSLRDAFTRAHAPEKEKNQAPATEHPSQVTLGPKNEPGMHLRPDGPERKAVDAQRHSEELAQARIQAKQLLDACKDRQAQQQAETIKGREKDNNERGA